MTLVFVCRRPMWFTHSKRTFMEKFSVLSWWVTSVPREATTHLVRCSFLSVHMTLLWFRKWTPGFLPIMTSWPSWPCVHTLCICPMGGVWTVCALKERPVSVEPSCRALSPGDIRVLHPLHLDFIRCQCALVFSFSYWSFSCSSRHLSRDYYPSMQITGGQMCPGWTLSFFFWFCWVFCKLGVFSLTYFWPFSHFSHLFFPFQRRPCHGHQRRHRGGQGQAGPPRAPQIQRRQLFHQFIFSSTLHHLNSITDYNERSLTAGFRMCVYTECPYSKAQPPPQTSMLLLWPIVDIVISPPCLEYISLSSLWSKG